MLFGQGMQQEAIGMRVLAHFVNSSIAVFRSSPWYCIRKLPTSAFNAVFPISSKITQPFTRCTPILAYTPFAWRLLRGIPVHTKIICTVGKTPCKCSEYRRQDLYELVVLFVFFRMIQICASSRCTINIYGDGKALDALDQKFLTSM